MRLARARFSAVLRPLLLLALTYTLYTYFQPNPPADAAFGLLPFPDYTRNNHFRPYADPDYEAAVDTALVALETAARASASIDVAQYPVRRIWQTASDESERTADAKDWEHKNAEWNYKVGLPIIPRRLTPSSGPCTNPSSRSSSPILKPTP